MFKLDFLLFLLIFSIFAFSRFLLFCFYAHSNIEDENIFSHFNVECFYLAFRFDVMSATYISLFSIVVSVVYMFYNSVLLLKIKRVYNTFAVLISVLLCICNFYFFKEYNTQFNYFIFGIVDDQTLTVMSVIWDKYPCFIIGVVLVLVSFVLWNISGRAFSGMERDNFSLAKKIVITISIIPVIICGLRGGQLWGKVVSNEMIAVSDSSFICGIIPNPAYLLKLEATRYLKKNCLAYYGAKDSDMKQYSAEVFGNDLQNMDTILQKKVLKPSSIRPDRIFLVIGESHSSSNLKPKYTNGETLCPQTLFLLNKYPSCLNAVSAGLSTYETILSIFSGFPSLKSGFSTKITNAYMPARYLKEIGWNCNFYYAGKSSWNRLGETLEFCHVNVIGGEKMGSNYGTKAWGMPDEDLFKYVLSQNIEKNSVSVVLTVSNHDPYDIDLKKNGLAQNLLGETEKAVWHSWYSDKQIGAFTKNILQKYPNSLVIISGDHHNRAHFTNIKTDAEYMACVPIIFVSNRKLSLPDKIQIASHADIFPTIFDFIAPEGFVYRSFGSSLFNGDNRQSFNDSYAYYDGKFYSLKSTTLPISFREKIRKFHALAAWRIFNKDGVYPDYEK